MKNVVVIGQSPAVHAAVRSLLDRDAGLALTVISCDGQFPYDRMLLPGLIDRSLKEADLFCAPQEFYQSARVQVILDKEISRVNFGRKRIFLADRVQVDFDGLIIADASLVQLPQIKGVRRQGVFHLARLAVVKDLVRYLAFTETVLVEALGFSGIKAALALKAAGKDVIVAARQGALLPGVLSSERALDLAAALERRGVRVVFDSGIEDVIGDAEVKAVRLKSGKVVACDMVVIEDVSPDLHFLSGTELLMTERIPVAEAMRSSIRDVHAVDVVCQMDHLDHQGNYWQDAAMGCVQALAAVDGLWGQDRILTAEDCAPALWEVAA